SQPGFGPPSLPVGTEVSAKYRGAFCEAKVKTVVRVVKCKVVMKDCQTSIFVTDEEIKGSVKHPETGQPVEGTINKLIDHSSYTVVFDDGDERTLRRSQLCLKGDKHFIESETLDNLPLSHPEHFGTPVLQNKKSKRKNDDESGDEGEDGSEEESPRRAMYRGRHQELVGKLMLVDFPNRKGSMIPALVVLPDANSLNEVKNRDQILVRSFKDSKFLTVTRKVLKDFSRPIAIKNDEKTMRTAFEKALLYYDTKELPVGWNKEEMLGSDVEDDGDEDVEDEYASEDEPFEEKDRFVAQLYKFMDERGTPINKGPCIGNKDLNLYKLYKIVEKLGGYNKVTKEMKWPVVYSKMGLPSLHQNPAHQIKSAYKKYLDAFESFYRKLGSTMGTMSRPGRGRQSTGGRSILNPRAKEKSPRTPKPTEKTTPTLSKDEAGAVKQKPEVILDKQEENQDAASIVSVDDEDVVMRRTPRRDAKALTPKDEIKEKKEEAEKTKKDEKKDEPLKNKKEEKKDEPLKNKKEEKKDEPLKNKKEEKKDEPLKNKKDEKKDELLKNKKEEKKDELLKNKKEEKKDEPLKNKKEEKKDDISVVKSKKEDTPVSKVKKEETTPVSKVKKDELAKVKKDDDSAKKEERKSARKVKGEEEKEGDKEEKKSARGNKKQKEEESKEEVKLEITTPVKDSPKKRITRRKLLPTEPQKEPDVKEETEEQKEQAKKPVIKENKPVEKKDKEIPRTLERRDSRASDKKEPPAKIIDKKDVKLPSEKKVKSSEEKRPKKEKKGDEDEGSDDNRDMSNTACSEGEAESDQDKSDGSVKHEYPIGSRLKVKYGRGKNQKIYIAKVIDYGKDGAHRTYLVHYAGWNTRYDEWIRPDRVVSVLDRPDGSKSRTPPLRSPSFPGCLKRTPLPNSSTNTPQTLSDLNKSEQVFRTPKIMGAKTRATRSSSSETSIVDKKTGKRMTRRHSVLTDSTGSKSPGSATASDADDGSGSERADDEDIDDDDDEDVDANSKVQNAGDEDILDVDDYEESEEDSVKGKLADTSMENEVTSPEDSVSDMGSERVEEEEDGGESEKETSVANQEDKSMVPVESDLSTEEEQEKDSKNLVKEDSSADSVIKSVVSVVKPDARPQKAAVRVVEIRDALEEIKSAVCCDQGDIKLEDYYNAEEPETLTAQEMNIDVENSASPKLEIVEEETVVEKEEQDVKTDCKPAPCDKEPDDVCAAELLLDQAAPVLKKVDAEPPKKDKDTEKPKAGRGRKNISAKEGKKANKSSDAINANIASEIPALEPVVMSPVLTVSKLEPSPYDFDAEVDTPWQPEITKKWEPSQKSTPVKENKESLSTPEEGEEKEKKKVKKKAKKKSISPEFVGEERSLLVDDTAVVNPSDISAAQATADTPVDSKGRKKKGRKKKEVDCETKKEVSELYESTVNSVVEAVKHSLQEIESDQEQKPVIKRRKVKQVSESDKKDTGVRITKVGRKVAGRDSGDVLENSLINLEGDTAVRANSSPLTDHATPQTAHSDEVPCTSSSNIEPLEDIDFKDNKKESSFMESEGFEPQLESSDPSAAFDNTPPTTPEHEEEGNRSPPMQHPVYHSHSEDVSLKSDSHKDNVKAICSSYIPSTSLPTSSSNLTTSKSAGESPSDNDVISTTSTDNLDAAVIAQQSESSGTDQDIPSNKKRKVLDDTSNSLPESKKKRVHGTRSRTAKKSPKYVGNSDSQGSTSNTPSHCPESPPTKLADLSKSPRPSKFNFSADLGEYLEGEARCNFLITKMREIKAIYMNLKSEVASIDRRRKRARRREKESSQMSSSDKVAAM
ncbi:unnamed protein product, partial [Candidula unifasciata]